MYMTDAMNCRMCWDHFESINQPAVPTFPSMVVINSCAILLVYSAYSSTTHTYIVNVCISSSSCSNWTKNLSLILSSRFTY